MVIYLDQYRAALAVPIRALKNGTYGDASRDVNRNTEVVYLFNHVAPRAVSPELPADLAAVDVDAFLVKVYALATQI